MDNAHEQPAAPTTPVLAAEGLSKSFGPVQALRSVDFTLLGGEIHALVGDNGAGKSTMLKILAGVQKADAGRLLMNGRPVSFDSPLDARNQGVETVYQDLALADERSSSANVFIGREVLHRGVRGRLRFLDCRSMDAETAKEFRELSVTVKDVKMPVRMLSGGQRQGVAIARAALWARHVVLLDEPTAALGVVQRASVTELVGRLRAKGIGIVLVSHDIPAVLEVADRISVLRLGRVVATSAASEVDLQWVVSAMVGGMGD
jgi:simple sugar transport system ATP-binding protein